MIGLSHGGGTMYRSTRLSQDLLVGTTDGLVALRSNGDLWSECGHYLEGKHIHAILPTEQYLFVGAWWDGVYASPDNGNTWEERDRGITVRSLFSLSSVPLAMGLRLFAGTEPAHLFYSDDLGLSWTELPHLRDVQSLPQWRFAADPFEAHVKHIAFAPNNSDHMFVSVEVGGLLESLDAGFTWNDIVVPSPDVHRLIVDPRDSLVMKTTGGAGLLMTHDGGISWDELLPKNNEIGSYPDQFVHLPSNPDVCWIAASQTGPRSWVRDGTNEGFAGGRIGASLDGGWTWEIVHEGVPDRFHGNVEAMCIEEAEDGFQLFAGTTDGEIWWSGKNGKRWQLIANTAPVSKSVHTEMLTGDRTHALRFSDGQQVERTT